MKYAADFRMIAREALKGKWLIAVMTGVIAALLGGLGSEGPQVEVNLDAASGMDIALEYAGNTIFSVGSGVNNGLAALLAGSMIYIALAVIALAIAYFILGSIVEVGYARFNLDLVDKTDEKLETLFGYFGYWKSAAATGFMKSLYIALGFLLLIIPGILATYSYAMTGYLLAEYPQLTAEEALSRSKAMMEGNRFRLFCLEISFLGWDFLSALTLGIGNLWLQPYKQAAKAAFYREISGVRMVERTGDYYETL